MAVKEGILSVNPARNTIRPKVTSPDVKVLTVDQQEKIMKEVPNDTIGVLIKLALGTGCRIGELLGLKWSDIDFKNREAHINQALLYTPTFDYESNTYMYSHCELSNLKTTSSHRIIPLSDNLIAILSAYKLNQRAYICQLPENIEILPEMIFLNEKGNYLDPRSATKRYHKVLKSLGIPSMKFHALRHTFATRILEANVHPKVAQTLLGHTSCDITMNIYSHVLPDQTRDAIDRLKGII